MKLALIMTVVTLIGTITGGNSYGITLSPGDTIESQVRWVDSTSNTSVGTIYTQGGKNETSTLRLEAYGSDNSLSGQNASIFMAATDFTGTKTSTFLMSSWGVWQFEPPAGGEIRINPHAANAPPIKVGINTATIGGPTEALEVVGNIKVSQDIIGTTIKASEKICLDGICLTRCGDTICINGRAIDGTITK